jgi:hypothetical protein
MVAWIEKGIKTKEIGPVGFSNLLKNRSVIIKN